MQYKHCCCEMPSRQVQSNGNLVSCHNEERKLNGMYIRKYVSLIYSPEYPPGKIASLLYGKQSLPSFRKNNQCKQKQQRKKKEKASCSEKNMWNVAAARCNIVGGCLKYQSLHSCRLLLRQPWQGIVALLRAVNESLSCWQSFQMFCREKRKMFFEQLRSCLRSLDSCNSIS